MNMFRTLMIFVIALTMSVSANAKDIREYVGITAASGAGSYIGPKAAQPAAPAPPYAVIQFK